MIKSVVAAAVSSLIMTCQKDQQRIETKDGATNKVHGLRDQATRHSDVDGCLLAITSEHPDLDASHLESMDRIGNSFLQLVLDRRRAEEEHVLLDDFSRLIQSFTATIDCLCRLIIDRGPFLVLLLWYISVGEAECSQPISSVFLEGIELSWTMVVFEVPTSRWTIVASVYG